MWCRRTWNSPPGLAMPINPPGSTFAPKHLADQFHAGLFQTDAKPTPAVARKSLMASAIEFSRSFAAAIDHYLQRNDGHEAIAVRHNSAARR